MTWTLARTVVAITVTGFVAVNGFVKMVTAIANQSLQTVWDRSLAQTACLPSRCPNHAQTRSGSYNEAHLKNPH